MDDALLFNRLTITPPQKEGSSKLMSTSATAPATEFSDVFVQRMRNCMSVSFFKYGPVAAAYPEKVDALESLQMRLERYVDTGNTEFLVDAANFAMIEFMHPRHPNAFYKATDSKESPGRATADGKEVTHRSNHEIGV